MDDDYHYIRFQPRYNIFDYVREDQYEMECFRKCDDMLHQALIKEIFSSRQPKSHHALIKSILRQSPGLEEWFPIGNLRNLSLLWIAILCSYHRSAELLVRYGADVNEIIPYFQPYMVAENSSVLHVLLLMYPSAWNNKLIRLVIDHGANLEVQDSNDRTPLDYAISKGRVDAVEMFLQKGANLNVVGQKGLTPLFLAARTQQAGVMLPLLMRYGADITAKDPDDKNVLHHLAYGPKAGLVDLVRDLIEKGVSLEDRSGRLKYQPIHLAAIKANNHLMELYLDYGANVDAQDGQGYSPLHYVLEHFNEIETEKMIRTLLKRGANIHLRTITGRTTLHTVCERAKGDSNWSIYYECRLKMIMSAGADILAEDNKGNTPFACMMSDDIYTVQDCTLSNKLMLKALAIKKVQSEPKTKLKDERIMKKFPVVWNYYQECIEHAYAMRFTRFIKTCTFLNLLTKSRYEIARLMRHRDFKPNFFKHKIDDSFAIYANDILEVLQHADTLYWSMLEQEDVINEAFYYTLPHLVVRKITNHVFNDCCKIDSIYGK